VLCADILEIGFFMTDFRKNAQDAMDTDKKAHEDRMNAMKVLSDSKVMDIVRTGQTGQAIRDDLEAIGKMYATEIAVGDKPGRHAERCRKKALGVVEEIAADRVSSNQR
jgi:hypothetical protein